VLAVFASLGDVVLRLCQFVLVDQHFGVVGFGEGVGGVQLDRCQGFGFRLVEVVFGHFPRQGGVGKPAEHKGPHRKHVGIGGLGFFGDVDDGESLVEGVAAFLIGGEAGG